MAETSEKTQLKKRILKIVAQTLIYAFALFGIIFILTLFGVLSLINPSAKLRPLPERAVLNVDLDQSYTEVRPDDLLADFTGQSAYAFYDLSKALYTAADDPKILALTARIGETSLGMAQIQDLADALTYFRTKGKKAVIFSSGMGSFGGGSKEYYLASFFDEIWLQPNSDIGLTGVGIEVPFFKKLLKKIGVQAEFYTRYEYKTAVSSLLNSDFTPAYKEELEKLGQGLYAQLVEGISTQRNLPAEKVRAIIDTAPVLSEQALENGLIDHIGYHPSMLQNIQAEYQAEVIDVEDYIAHQQVGLSSAKDTIALLALEGTINEGESSDMPLNEISIGAQTVLQQLEELKAQKDLKALVVRIDSPGGSYSASDEIRFALEEFKAEKQIPIVVSMGDYAASGGYFIALAGDKIIAEPATLTGSIGVLGGKFVLAELWQKLDISWGSIKYGQNADILSANHPFTPAQQKIFNQSLDRIYEDFTAKTLQARHLNPTETDKIARGRVWLGSEAEKLGLIDKIGGIKTAFDTAAELAELAPNAPYRVVYYPRPTDFQEKLTSLLTRGGFASSRILQESGLDTQSLGLLWRLKFDAVLPPFRIRF